MKRINVNMDEKVIHELDLIVERIKHESGYYLFWESLARADLIRLAVGRYFGLDIAYVHRSADQISSLLKDLLIIKK